MKTILLAGYRHHTLDDVELAPGLRVQDDGTLLIDQRIAQLRSLGHQIICVIAGESADELIRRSRALLDVELVFDTHGEDVNLVSNVRAGLAALGRETCFVLPVEVPLPKADVWKKLAAAGKEAGGSVSLAQVRRDDPADLGFPLLVTRHGTDKIKALPDLKSLADTRLEYLRPTI